MIMIVINDLVMTIVTDCCGIWMPANYFVVVVVLSSLVCCVSVVLSCCVLVVVLFCFALSCFVWFCFALLNTTIVSLFNTIQQQHCIQIICLSKIIQTHCLQSNTSP